MGSYLGLMQDPRNLSSRQAAGFASASGQPTSFAFNDRGAAGRIVPSGYGLVARIRQPVLENDDRFDNFPSFGYSSNNTNTRATLAGLGCECEKLAGLGDADSTVNSLDVIDTSKIPANLLVAAQAALQTWANLIRRAVDKINNNDRAGVNDTLSNIEKSDDLSAYGFVWQEGKATKSEVLATLRQLLAEVDMAEPGFWSSWLGAPPKQVEAFKAAALAIAARIEGRISESNFSKPALTQQEVQSRGMTDAQYQAQGGGILTAAQAKDVQAGELSWDAKIKDDQDRAMKQLCNPTTVLTGEKTIGQYWSDCVPTGIKVGLGLVGALLVYNVVPKSKIGLGAAGAAGLVAFIAYKKYS